MPNLVDSHCHLQDRAFDPDREAVLARALEELAWILVVGDTIETSRQALALVRPGVYAAAGIHPHHASTCDTQALADLRALVRTPGVLALGEIGLDYFYDHTPRPAQRATLEAQLALAAELGLPVVLHCRNAQEDMAEILATHAPRLRAGGVMHCFSGDSAFAARCVEWGLHISFAGNVTFPKAAALREAAATVPLERLLVETDSPYLAPPPHRGRRCEPPYVRHTAALLAEIQAVTLEVFAAHTSANAGRLFRVEGTVR